MYHCHILAHEGRDTMRPIVVTPKEVMDSTSRPGMNGTEPEDAGGLPRRRGIGSGSCLLLYVAEPSSGRNRLATARSSLSGRSRAACRMNLSRVGAAVSPVATARR